MRFKFNLETLLKQREREADLARKEYNIAQTKVDDSLKTIETMWQDIQFAREKMVKDQTQGGRKTHLLSDLDEFVNGHKVRIEREKNQLRELIIDAEEKREILVESAREHKIITRLKEKMLARHKLEQKKKESKELDDLVIMRHKRSG